MKQPFDDNYCADLLNSWFRGAGMLRSGNNSFSKQEYADFIQLLNFLHVQYTTQSTLLYRVHRGNMPKSSNAVLRFKSNISSWSSSETTVKSVHREINNVPENIGKWFLLVSSNIESNRIMASPKTITKFINSLTITDTKIKNLLEAALNKYEYQDEYLVDTSKPIKVTVLEKTTTSHRDWITVK